MSRDLLYSRATYIAPSWISSYIPESKIPHHRIHLGQLPTPLHPLKLHGIINSAVIDNDNNNTPLSLMNQYECWMKRDDMSSFDLTGNKIRKLEFLLADAIEKGHESVITIGGLQSNHARATAVAAAQLGLKAHLILRTPLTSIEEIDLTGNLLFNRLTNASIYTVSPGTYAQFGSISLTNQLAQQLVDASLGEPYIIPVGGSNELGLYGYIDCVSEILSSGISFDHVVFACGSGGTAMGLSLGFRLAQLHQPSLKVPKVHAVNVCDRPEYFYHHMEEISAKLGLDLAIIGHPREWLNIYPGVGVGYAKSTEEELKFIYEFGSRTGVVLDPVYGGKALYYFVTNVLHPVGINFNSDIKKRSKILFIHTGGTFGLYEKQRQLLPLLDPHQVTKMKVNNKS